MGNNAVFLLDNRLDSASLVASSSAAAMPVTNIQSEARSDVWRSGPGSSSTVDATFNSAGTVGVLGFVDLNMSTAGTLRVQAWTDAINGAANVFDMTYKPNVYGYDPNGATYLYGAGAYGIGNYGLATPLLDQLGRNVTVVLLSAPVSARFWRFTFTDGNTAYQQVSRIYLTAAAKTYTYNISYGWKASRRERSQKKESLGGQRYVQKRDARLAISASFDYLTEVERADVLSTIQTFGEVKPFVFSVFPENSAQGLTTSLYGTFESPDVTHRNYNLTNYQFTVVEEF